VPVPRYAEVGLADALQRTAGCTDSIRRWPSAGTVVLAGSPQPRALPTIERSDLDVAHVRSASVKRE